MLKHPFIIKYNESVDKTIGKLSQWLKAEYIPKRDKELKEKMDAQQKSQQRKRSLVIQSTTTEQHLHEDKATNTNLNAK